jgi:hypothetical protein
VCDLETSNIRRPRPYLDCWAIEKNYCKFYSSGIKNVMLFIRGAQGHTL